MTEVLTVSSDRVAKLKRLMQIREAASVEKPVESVKPSVPLMIDGVKLVDDEEMRACCRLIEDQYYEKMVEEICPEEDVDSEVDEEDDEIDENATLVEEVPVAAKWRMLKEMGVELEW